MYIYKILQIFAMAIFLMYVSGCAFFFTAKLIYDSLDDEHQENSWYHVYAADLKSTTDMFILTCYFTLTILSQVGYGDITPQNQAERLYILLF